MASYYLIQKYIGWFKKWHCFMIDDMQTAYYRKDGRWDNVVKESATNAFHYAIKLYDRGITNVN